MMNAFIKALFGFVLGSAWMLLSEKPCVRSTARVKHLSTTAALNNLPVLHSLNCSWSCSRMRRKPPAPPVRPPAPEAGPASASNRTRAERRAAGSTRRPSAARLIRKYSWHTLNVPCFIHICFVIRVLHFSSVILCKCWWRLWTPPPHITCAASNPMTISWPSRKSPWMIFVWF